MCSWNHRKFHVLISQQCFRLINFKMPTNVGILTFMSRIIPCSVDMSMRSFITLTPGRKLKCHFSYYKANKGNCLLTVIDRAISGRIWYQDITIRSHPTINTLLTTIGVACVVGVTVACWGTRNRRGGRGRGHRILTSVAIET